MSRRSVYRAPLAGLAVAILLVIIVTLSGCFSDRLRQLYTTMEGTVTDSSGNPIEGAQVYVYGVEPKKTTNSDGFYQIAWVPLGVVEVIAEKEGYPISWGRYCKYAIPATILVIAVCNIYLIFRYGG